MNEFSDSRIITFTEQKTGDVVDIEFQIEENERGYFSEEYRPDTIAKEDAKVIDITAFIINEEKRICCWWLYDLKKDVGGQDYLADTSMETKGKIGVITRNFDTDRIQVEKVCFRCAGEDMEFPIDVKISTERTSEEYYYRLRCSQALC